MDGPFPENIVICPFCNYAFPANQINAHADDHFADNIEADRLVAEYLQQKYNDEAAAQAARNAPPKPPARTADDALKTSLQAKLREFRVADDAAKAKELQDQLDAENLMMGPTVDYMPQKVPHSLGALVVPATWTLDTKVGGYALRCAVTPGTTEYKTITDKLLKTLGFNTVVRRLERIQNPAIWARYVATTNRAHEGLFFHGCRNKENEVLISRGGFDVKKCVSGGANYGTWFAYQAAYSASGFAYNDGTHIRLFINQVSLAKPVMHHAGSMVVVGKDYAYPAYVVVFDAMTATVGLLPPTPMGIMPALLSTHLKSRGYEMFGCE
jgi:hypothetical protein